MNSVQIAKMIIDNGYLTDAENRNKDNSINWNFVSADVRIDCPLEITTDAEERAYDLLEECIGDLSKLTVQAHKSLRLDPTKPCYIIKRPLLKEA